MGRDQRRLNNRYLESSVVSSLYFVTKTPYPNVLFTTRAPFLLVPLQCEESLIYFAEKGESVDMLLLKSHQGDPTNCPD